jgi:hypothetical protein
MKKVSAYILFLSDCIDKKCPELFYFIPNYYNTTVFTIVKSLLRVNLLSLEFVWGSNSFKFDIGSLFNIGFDANSSVLELFISFVTRHLADKRIPNPDQQQDFLIKLLFLIRNKETLKKIEGHPVAKEMLLVNLMNAFEQKHILLLSMNLLMLLKGDLYNDEEVNNGSKYYQMQFIELCKKDGKLLEHFLNLLLNHINDLITEVKLNYVESNNNSLPLREQNNNYGKARTGYTVLYKAVRALELVATLVPFAFLDGVFIQRTSDLCMHIIREGTHGQLNKLLNELDNGDNKKIETTEMLACPIAGIYLALYQFLSKENDKSKKIEKYIIKADGFELELMKTFIKELKDTK